MVLKSEFKGIRTPVFTGVPLKKMKKQQLYNIIQLLAAAAVLLAVLK